MIEGRRYRSRKQYTPVCDRHGKVLEWVWTHMALYPLDNKKPAEAGSKTTEGAAQG